MTETIPFQAADGAVRPSEEVPVVDLSATGLTSTPLQQAMDLAREHGPVFRRRLHGHEAMFVSSLELVTELADEDRFAKGVSIALENVREFAGDGLFTAYNEEPNWAKAHDILMPAFALGSMRTYHPAMLKVARRVIGSWDRRAAEGGPVDVPDDMTRMTLDTIGLAGFGFDFESFGRDTPHPFVEAMVRCLEWSMNRMSREPGGDYTEEDAAFQTDADYLASVVDEVIASRTGEGGGADESSDDLLGLMLGATHPADGTTLDLANIRNQVITFLIAGHETTSGALSFALYHLLKDPAALRLAQREADELWGDQDDPDPSFEDIGRLPFTRQVLNEALRLWPTAAAFTRQARTDTLLGGRYPLRAGQLVSVLTPMLHRDPVWGDNPELFDPTRFAPEAEAARSPHAYKPFGTGERACIGRQFALHEATMLLAMLVHRYRLIDHTDYQLRIKETLTLKPDDFTLIPGRRTAADRAAVRAALAVLPGGAAEGDGTEPDADDGLPTRARQDTGLLLLHGTNYGTCRDFAERLADEATGLGFTPEVAPLDAAAGALPTDRPVVIVTASYNGQPTDDAARFMEWIGSDEARADGVPYAVLGVGDRNWAATYQRIPTLLDERLADLGAERLLPRGEADASGDLNGAVKAFTAALRTELMVRYGDPASIGAAGGDAAATDAYTVREVTGGPLDALAARHGLQPMTVTEARDLTAPGHPRVKRFLRLALPDGVTYRTADHLAVLPANGPAAVERAARVLGVDPDTVLDIRAGAARSGRDTLPVDRPLTVRELLTRHVELGARPTPEQRALLAAHNPCPPERAALQTVADDDPRSVLDLIEEHPALRGALPWPVILDLLPALRIRHYSLSSSPAADPRHADLMVSLLPGGTGSGHLHTLKPGDTVLARVQPCREAFRIDPADPAPVILIAAGTGLAPFRGAVADRLAAAPDGRSAPALLYFGCDAPDADYLHADELRAAEAAGAVSLRPAFSARPEGDCRYVQHRVAAEADEVGALLDAGARVYVCGDGSRMAPGVRAAFRALHTSRTGATDEEAEAWLRDLTAAGRYVEDVYAAG
ncbi:bifunctional cytochrome P450/NADPH--P450 reductase [Streptomyces sp. NPDC059788]|uniref:bifunctional cytochrome P450/NADPH--P450 reductase n=1 Tax=Streptomyces sp. NPDC059788 TaxID=3346948 RepID=UPI00365157C1